MQISLKKKKLSSGKLSWYIEFYDGSYVDKNGTMKHNRSFEYLKLYTLQEPQTAIDKKKDKETVQLANQILSIRKSEYFQGKHSIKNDKKSKTRFLDYYNELKNERNESKGNYGNWDAAGKHLERYCSPTLTFDNVDDEFAKGFKRFLDSKSVTKSGIALSQNSKYTYFNKFKAALRQAFEDGFLTEDITKRIKSFDQGESQREYLVHSELQALAKADCKYQVLKNAFIFSCLSGLRWSDIDKLKWSEVRDEDTGCRIIFRQKKTDGLEYLYISDQARSLLGERTGEVNKVFKGLKYGAHFNAEILRWCMRAGITKHITFHSARHTNAVLLLENGADIYTVSKRLGHKEIRTTEIYTRIIDSKMKEASELIPKLDINL
ncbi:site-specific integrase [Algibacter pectinivorans]|uniref:Site-specific recombinase XerD n=1 Tax=Algibacter pectinivorans TaxID=870482 RepID=A0A1I1RMB3_9FLAO|nr:site-specific integrase [Algibacter pectinivorans]SFD35292.1 Site-specific recombinase XerD [Algibacter pectinivorans]